MIVQHFRCADFVQARLRLDDGGGLWLGPEWPAACAGRTPTGVDHARRRGRGGAARATAAEARVPTRDRRSSWPPRPSRPGGARVVMARGMGRSSRSSRMTRWRSRARFMTASSTVPGCAITPAARSRRTAATSPASRTARGASSTRAARCSATTRSITAPASSAAGTPPASCTASARCVRGCPTARSRSLALMARR